MEKQKELMHTPSFSVDWFSQNIPVWTKHLSKYVGKPNVNALEVGSYEGRSAIWLLENVLTHDSATITCVDHFSQKDKKTRKDVHKTFLSNMESYKKKYKLFKEDSGVALKMPQIIKHQYDIIYIDADHHSRHVLEDAVLCFALLKPGGIMILDDNTDNKEHDNNCPKPAIAAFVNAYANECKVLHSKWQVIITKRSKPLKKAPCRSEFFTD